MPQCVAEEIFSTEGLVRLDDRRNGLDARLRRWKPPGNKVISVDDSGGDAQVEELKRSREEVEIAIGTATFTGKGDRAAVLGLLDNFDWAVMRGVASAVSTALGAWRPWRRRRPQAPHSTRLLE